MKWLENNIWLRQLGYILHDYIYRPIKLFQYKCTWKLHGNELSIYNRTLNKPRVLYISLINGGGLKKHLGDLVKGMRDEYDVWILYDDNILWHWEGGKWKVIRYFDISLDYVIWLMRPHVIHIHQLSRTLHEIDTLLNPMYKNAKLIITIHDLYVICPHFFMTECMGTKFCHPSRCSETWRYIMNRLLLTCDIIVCPSSAMRDMISFYYPDVESKCIIIEHGVENVFTC